MKVPSRPRPHGDRHYLVQILRAAQDELGWISRDAEIEIARRLGIPVSDVEAVVKFYAFFYEAPRGRYRVLFSDNITDRMAGNVALFERLLEHFGLERGVVLADGRISVDLTSCTGLCDQCPALLVNDIAINRLDENRIDAIPPAEDERHAFLAAGGGKVLHGALFFHWARMIEMLHAAELARDLLNDPEIVGVDLIADKGARREEAVGVIEAPRGTLFHHYKVNGQDLVTYCNLIVSTTNNNQAMNEAVRAVATQFFDGREVTEGLLDHVEIAIRAYDPCLSCATHALGAMPLEVEVRDAEGALVSVRRKD